MPNQNKHNINGFECMHGPINYGPTFNYAILMPKARKKWAISNISRNRHKKNEHYSMNLKRKTCTLTTAIPLRGAVHYFSFPMECKYTETETTLQTEVQL